VPLGHGLYPGEGGFGQVSDHALGQGALLSYGAEDSRRMSRRGGRPTPVRRVPPSAPGAVATAAGFLSRRAREFQSASQGGGP